MTEEEQKAAADAEAAKAAEAEAAKSSEELKPLTDEEMESMTTEEITAHAEKLEAQVKESKKQTPDQIRENQIARAKKAQEKAFSKDNDQTTAPETKTEKKSEIAQADILTLAKQDFDIGSEEQTLLQKRVEQGVIATYAEGLTNVGVKAELAAIAEKNTAKTVIDENDDPETQLKTKQEAVAAAKASGEYPDDPELQKAIVDDNLNNMSSLK